MRGHNSSQKLAHGSPQIQQRGEELYQKLSTVTNKNDLKKIMKSTTEQK